jgi:uncharacterized protein
VSSGLGESSGSSRQKQWHDQFRVSLRDDFLQLILLPTEQCNFRCVYCYEDFAIGRMAAETVTAVTRLIDRRIDGLSRLALTWFGGEPMLARDVIEEISSHVLARAAHLPGLTYAGDMTTNGYFLDAAAVDRLVALGVTHFQVSLDGPPEQHDRTRLRGDGRGTFARIWDNLVSVRDGDAPVDMMLRVHLTPANVGSMPAFLTRVRDVFLDDPRFKVYLKPIEHLGGPNDADLTVLSPQERRTVVADLNRILTRGKADPSTGLAVPPAICYAARPNSFVIRANGLIGKCTVALSDPANVIGQLRADGTVDIDNGRLRPWLRGWPSGDEAVLGCPANGIPSQPPLLQIRSAAARS